MTLHPDDSIELFEGQGTELMAIKKYKPTSPGRRFATYLQARGRDQGRAREVAHRGTEEVRRAQRPWPRDLAPPRRRRQAQVPQDRLQAAQGRHPGEGRRDRVRPEPLGAHRAAPLRGRREALHPGAGPDQGRRHRHVGPRRGHRAGLRATDPEHPHRYDGPQRGAHARSRRPAGPLRRDVDPAGREGGPLRDPAAALRRDAHGARGVPRDDRGARQRRARAGRARQGRPLPAPGQAPADARSGHEPGGPPARRRRGAPHARRPPEDPVGRADARLPHPQEEEGARTATSCAAGAVARREGGRCRARPRRARGFRSA